MMWFDNEIEQQALHAYHNEPWTDEDYETMGISREDNVAVTQSRGFRLRNFRSQQVMYEGGNDDQ